MNNFSNRDKDFCQLRGTRYDAAAKIPLRFIKLSHNMSIPVSITIQVLFMPVGELVIARAVILAARTVRRFAKSFHDLLLSPQKVNLLKQRTIPYSLLL